MRNILPIRRPGLVYPGGTPGFDPNHIAAGKITRFTGVCTRGSFRNLLRQNAAPTVSGTITSAIDGRLGPVLITADSTVNFITFTGNAAVQDLIQTIGMICLPTTIGSYCVTSGDGTNGIGFFCSGTNWGYSTSAGAFNDSGIPFTANVPVFVALSINSTTCNFVVCNLSTGQIKSSSNSGLTQAGAGNGTYFLLGDNNGDVGAVKIAAWMFSAGTLLSLQQLREWAANPWSFWYPTVPDLNKMIAPSLAVDVLHAQAML